MAAVLASTLLFLCVAAVGATLWRLAGEGKPLSPVDEYVHADTAFKVHHGRYPFRGARLGQEVIDTWHCHTGHQAITFDAACGSPESTPDGVPTPTGPFTTGYIHYPTYFLAGEAFRRVGDGLAGAAEHAIDTYRRFAALVQTLGILVSAAMARLLGLRGSALLAAALAPVAAPAILVYGTMVNPMSAATLCGAVVAGAGIRWMLTGRGFWWLVAATLAAASVAVTASLPGGVFVLAVLIGLLLRLRGGRFDSGWTPRLWHALVLLAVLLVPIVAFGAWIEARATTDDATLYASYQLADWDQVWLGVWAEVFASHLPWVEDGSLVRPELSTPRLYARAVGAGMPLLIVAVVLGSLIAGATGALRPLHRDRDYDRHRDHDPDHPDHHPDHHRHRRDPDHDSESDPDHDSDAAPVADARSRSVLPLLAGCSLLGLLVYPPLLRLLNAATAGIDYAIVSRYSISLAPLFVLVVLLLGRDHPWLARVLATLSAACVLALCVTAW